MQPHTEMEAAPDATMYEITATDDIAIDIDVEEQLQQAPTSPMVGIKPHAGAVLEWSGINYSVPIPDKTGEMRTLLHPMSGVARPGELLAVMGTSGAGKSTLLDVLAGRLESKDLKGLLMVNGAPVDTRAFRKETGYVMQSDALFPLLTVRETMRYAAYLRVQGKSRAEKDQLADDIVSLLRLDKAADTIVGDDDHRGLSGGEKRRVSIGVDIVHFPPVIFLDEPTSGLDSSTALSVIDSLKQLACKQNCTVVMTIHQPSTRLFNLLDRVLFLSAGQVTYFGLTSELNAAIHEIYAEAGLGEPPIANPPEVFLDLCDELVLSNRLDIITSKHAAPPASIQQISAIHQSEDNYANSFVGELYILSMRSLTNILRTPELFLARLGTSIGFAVLIGTMVLNTDTSSAGLRHRLAYFIFNVAFFYYTSLEALPIFLAEREIFQREYSRGAYRASSYTIATQIVSMPFSLALSLAFTGISWWLIGLEAQPDPFFFHVLCLFSVLVSGQTFATMMSVLVPNPMAGQTAGSGLFSVMFLFSGFFVMRDEIPDFWIWLHYLSLFKYGYDSMAVNAFKHYVTSDTQTNEEILQLYSIDGVDRGTGVGVLWLFTIVFRCVFYYRLVTRFSGSRK